MPQHRMPPPFTTTGPNGMYSSYPAYPPPYPPPYPQSYNSYPHPEYPRDRSPQRAAYNRNHSMSPHYQPPPRTCPFMPPASYGGTPAFADVSYENVSVSSTDVPTHTSADYGAARHPPERATLPSYRYPPDHPYHYPHWAETKNAEANRAGRVPPYRNIHPDFDRLPFLHPEHPQRRFSFDTLMQPKMEPTKAERASEPPAIRVTARSTSPHGEMDAKGESESEGAEYSTVVPSSHHGGDASLGENRQSTSAVNAEKSSDRGRKRTRSGVPGRRRVSTSTSSKRKKREASSSKERTTEGMHEAVDEQELMKGDVAMVINGDRENNAVRDPSKSVCAIEDPSKSQIRTTKMNGSDPSNEAQSLSDGSNLNSHRAGEAESANPGELNGNPNDVTDHRRIESNSSRSLTPVMIEGKPSNSGQPFSESTVNYARRGVGSSGTQIEGDVTNSEIDIMSMSPSPMVDGDEKFETSSLVSESVRMESPAPASASASELVGVSRPAHGDAETQPHVAPSSSSFCFCNGAVESTFYIGCDQCDQWFHGICVDVAESESRRLDKWYCSACVAESGGTLTAQYKRTCANPSCRRRANAETVFCSDDCGRDWAFKRVQEVLPTLKVDEDALDRARSKIHDYVDSWEALDTEMVNRLAFLREFRARVKQMLSVLDKRRERVCEVASAVRETCGFDERILGWAGQTDVMIRRLFELWKRAEEEAVEMNKGDTEMDVEFADRPAGGWSSPCDNVRGKCGIHDRWTDVKIWEIDLESVQLVEFLKQLYKEEETVKERLKTFRESLSERGLEVMLL
ncbi:hypothetical protein BJ742DRAFT_775223 [Cladochytrium replicatum]|nr:hypothetical protein BJ742DRAFT_775223 [Cladochytrium replicatum]